MRTEEFMPLTPNTVADLLASRSGQSSERFPNDRRRHPRWPFPCPVEIWVQGDDGRERYALATCHDLSECGVGVIADEALPIGRRVPIAIHQPEVTFHGAAIVRRCAPHPEGFLVGMEFETA